MKPALKIIASVLMITVSTLVSSQSFAQSGSSSSYAPSTPVSASRMDANKKVAVDFYNLALNDKKPDEAMKLISNNFRQHSVLVADGYTGLAEFLNWVRTDQPKLHADITRVFADGDFVILDVKMIRHPGDRGLAISEIYRVEGGKLAEHWDRIQEVPEKSKNGNGLFQ